MINLPFDTVVDGEIVIADAEGESNFGALQERRGKANRDAARQAPESPAILLPLELVRDAGADLAHQPLRYRRRHLELVLGPGATLFAVMNRWMASSAWS